MLERTGSGEWRGVHFRAYTVGEGEKPMRFNFRIRRDGITLGFSAEEWPATKGSVRAGGSDAEVAKAV
jgi:hypothetical protein